MEALAFPAVRPFEVWFEPEDGVRLPHRLPLRVGPRLLHYDAAVALAEATARELPAYGIQTGTVVVLWSSSILKILNVLPVPSLLDPPASPPALRPGPPRREVIRLILEDVQQLTRLSDPDQPAPATWIAVLHAVLQVIGSPDDLDRVRLADGQGMSMADLYGCVTDVLQSEEQRGATPSAHPPRPARIRSLAGQSH